MTKLGKVPDVGAPDSEQRNSPIFDESADELSMDLELEEGVCYFNNKAFAIGDYICSGNELLRCEGRGVWMREGSCYQ